jgi:hypothetical protein
MPYVDVWVDTEDAIEDASDEDLIVELEHRGYIVLGQTDDPLFKIRQSFLLDSPEEFRKFLVKYLEIQGMPV